MREENCNFHATLNSVVTLMVMFCALFALDPLLNVDDCRSWRRRKKREKENEQYGLIVGNRRLLIVTRHRLPSFFTIG
jgi:hypothetical protein